MPTIPTGRVERELRAAYLRWIMGITYDSKNLQSKIDNFAAQSQELIEKLGGQTAALGALADFPVPKRLDLSPHVGTIYNDMHQAAIQAGIMAGLQSTDVARVMFRAGMDKSFRRLERLARTETVSAYWKNAWDSIADLPALVMVWGSEDGPRTCAWCRERDGLVMASSSLRDHPNGRCTPIPVLRSQVDYRGSVDRDGSIFHDPAWDQPTTTTTRPAESVELAPRQSYVADEQRNSSWLEAQWEKLAELEGDHFRSGSPIEKAFGQFARYQDRDHKIVNAALRKGDIGSTAQKMIDGIDELMEKHGITAEHSILAYRGGASSMLKGAKVGDVVEDRAYTSVSISRSQAKNFGKVTEVEVPAGTRFLPGHLTEGEMVLPRGLRYEVISVDPPRVRIVQKPVGPAPAASTTSTTRSTVPTPDVTFKEILQGDEMVRKAKITEVYDGQKFGMAALNGQELGEFSLKVQRVVTEGSRTTVDMAVMIPQAGQVGRVQRIFDTDSNGKPYVRHEHMELTPQLQGQGFSTQFSAYSEAWYGKAGFTEIKVHAALDQGGYAWAKAGYTWDLNVYKNGYKPTDEASFLYKNMLVKRSGTPQGKRATLSEEALETYAKVMKRFDSDDPGVWPTPFELANLPGDVEVFSGIDNTTSVVPLGKWLMQGNEWYGVKRVVPE